MTKRLSPVYESPHLLRTFILVLFLLLVLVISSCKPRPSAAQSWGGKMTLNKAISKIAKTLVTKGKLKGQPVLNSPHDFFDRRSGLSLPLATLLREKMVTEMGHLGVRVILPGGDEDSLMILQGTWQRQKDMLALNMKVMKMTPLGPEAISAESTTIPLSEIDPRDLIPDLEAWGRYLVRRLDNNPRVQDVRTLHIRNFLVGRREGVTTDQKGYFSGWLRTILNTSRFFRPVDQQTKMKGVSVEEIRSRGIDIVPIETETTSTGLTSDLLLAEAEMTGEAWFYQNRSIMQIRLNIKERGGSGLASAFAEIPSEHFPEYILHPPPPHVPPAPPSKKKQGGGLSSNGLIVDLTTTRGEGQPFYHAGETMKFVVRLNRNAHLYLFGFGPLGKATLLHPVEPNGQLIKGAHPMHARGIPVIIPDDTAQYILVAAEPFGTETVWVAASEKPLSLPEKLTGEWADSKKLIELIRKQGLFENNGYAEASVELVTGR